MPFALQMFFPLALGWAFSPLLFGQGDSPCFAFLLNGDVSVSCGGTANQITRRGNIDEFAFSSDRSVLGYITSQTIRSSGSISVDTYTTTLVDLNSGQTRSLTGDNFLISTCGGLFWGHGPQRDGSGDRDLITGQEISVPDYRWFRCSSDRMTIVGTEGKQRSELYQGVPPQTKLASAGTFSNGTFSVSPDGSKVAFFANGSPVCVVASPQPAECARESAELPGAPSVSDSGEVLFTIATGQECYYKSASNFSPRRFPGSGPRKVDACLAVAYWRPGEEAVKISEPLGRSPQWISPADAQLLRKWAVVGGFLGAG